MSADNFKLVFDVTQEGYRPWPFPALGLILFGAAVYAFVYEYRRHRRFGTSNHVYPLVFSAIFFIATLGSFAYTFGNYITLRNAVRDGTCEVVEGTVTNFVPMPYNGHASEHFIVNGHYFEYSNFNVTAAFNHTQSHGGPLAEGSRVRICAVGRKIARLEIAW